MVRRGHRVREVAGLAEAEGAGHVVLCNPNNPDGRRFEATELLRLADRLARNGGTLVVDEAFADLEPPGLSLAPSLPHPAIAVLRSFGKSYGLAGLRLGFVLCSRPDVIREALGPWAVSGPAIAAGLAALPDQAWRRQATARLAAGAARLDRLLARSAMRPAGGTHLFRLFEGEAAAELHLTLGRRGVLVRAFAGHPTRLRFGIPGDAEQWSRLEDALATRR